MGKDSGGKAPAKNKYFWLMYVAALLAGVLLIADAMNYRPLTRIPAKLGIALLFSAFAFMVGSTRAPVIIGAIIVWAAVILTFFV
jgi:hypothetical protein